jgi:hypothetical protein
MDQITEVYAHKPQVSFSIYIKTYKSVVTSFKKEYQQNNYVPYNPFLGGVFESSKAS